MTSLQKSERGFFILSNIIFFSNKKGYALAYPSENNLLYSVYYSKTFNKFSASLWNGWLASAATFLKIVLAASVLPCM